MKKVCQIEGRKINAPSSEQSSFLTGNLSYQTSVEQDKEIQLENQVFLLLAGSGLMPMIPAARGNGRLGGRGDFSFGCLIHAVDGL